MQSDEAEIVAKVYGEDVVERVRTRKCRASLRLRARQAATVKVANALDELISIGAPDDFDDEQEHAFLSTLRAHKHRMVGDRSRPMRANANGARLSSYPPGCDDAMQWNPRYSKEDFAQLRAAGFPVADWRLL